MALRLCASCSRHVRGGDDGCPFCGARASAAVPVPLSRATRAALVFGSATLVAAGVACGGVTEAADASSDAATPVDAGRDVNAQPPYGAPPPVDAGRDVNAPDGAPPDAAPDVNVQPPYGAPPPVDAGRD
jgi:hypothetical protein